MASGNALHGDGSTLARTVAAPNSSSPNSDLYCP